MKLLTVKQLQTLPIGTKLKCVSMPMNYNTKLIVGNTYTLLRHNTHGWLHVQEYSNNYEARCFTLIPVVTRRRTLKKELNETPL